MWQEKETQKRFIVIEDCVNTRMWGLRGIYKNSRDRLIVAAGNNINMRTNSENNKILKQKLEENNYMDISSNKNGTWLMGQPWHG